MQVLSVVGARPQFIKAAPLSRVLRQDHTEFLVHTGQHYDEDMSGIFFQQLGIPTPDANLGVGSGSHAAQTAGMLVPLEQLMQARQPDWVLVYGDTNSTLAGALAAKLHIPVAHVEAGLRSFNRTMPEEINRVLTDHLAALLFCPTPTAVDHLAAEGITQGVLLTGDVMVDAVMHSVARAHQESTIHARLGLHTGQPYAVVTIHRPANTDFPEALQAILSGLDQLPLPVIFPVHPRTRRAIQAQALQVGARVQRIAPLGYLDMLALVQAAAVLVTDSGGLQKEAYILETPCVTVRPETEWIETVQSGWNRLVPPEAAAIQAAVAAALQAPPAAHPNFYGDGAAAGRMVQALAAGAPVRR